MINGHQSPLDYLAHAFFQGRGGFGRFATQTAPVDCVVWAARGSGKTFLGAVATALDLIFKPGISIRILGGSLDQSRHMHAHLRTLFEGDALSDLVEGRIGETRLALKNGSAVELLAQSHTAVRGTRVQVLRCDEVELFKEDVFAAAMLTTRSKTIEIPGVGETEIAGSIECLSTMHVPFGLMSRLVKDSARTLFKWGVVDVLEDCKRTCEGCVLWEECGGRAKRMSDMGWRMSDVGKEMVARGKTKREVAEWQRGKVAEGKVKAKRCGARGARREQARDFKVKQRRTQRARNEVTGIRAENGDSRRRRAAAMPSARSSLSSSSSSHPISDIPHPTLVAPGHFRVDDAIRMKGRVSLAVWRAEMLCLEPSRADSVFPEFDATKHVFAAWERETAFRAGDPLASPDPLRTILLARGEPARMKRAGIETFLCGIDFGFRAPTVILWAALENDVLRILDERHVTGETTKQHVEAILKGNGKFWRVPEWIGADPAGKQRQSQTGKSDVQVLEAAGLNVRTRASEIHDGLQLIRARLAPAEGPVRLMVHERCRGLVEAFVTYHYRRDDPEDLRPVKDGSDHAIDALRYLVMNLDGGWEVASRRYA